MAVELGILGAGNMAEAIAGGVIGAGVLKADQIRASDVSVERRAVFEKRFGIPTSGDNRAVAGDARILLLSVKPQHMAALLESIADAVRPGTLIVSIAAGISSEFIQKHLGSRSEWHVIRTMPNTPMLIGEGMVALARGQHATEDDARRARKLFEAAADVVDVDEDKLDAVTGVSGSGPAYFFYLVEQMIKAGLDLGLRDAHARQLAVKTALGAAKMLAGSTESPQELRRRVTSPNGTTHAAITHMEKHDWAATTVEAVKAAARRSKELGN